MNANTIATKYWHKLDAKHAGDGRVQCDLCPRFCKLKDGQHGLCFVRANQGGQIVSTTYGLSSGFCVDPVEKKPLNHFLPGTPIKIKLPENSASSSRMASVVSGMATIRVK